MTWSPSPTALAASPRQSARYDDGIAWNGGAGCSGGPAPGTTALGQILRSIFPQILRTESYECRPNTANTTRTSIHGVGRALDVMVRDNSRDGDAIADWLVEHADELGVQYVIWDHVQWGAARTGEKFRPYTGPNPHTDHVHAELNLEGASLATTGLRETAPMANATPWLVTLAVGVVAAGAVGAYLVWWRR